MLEYVEIQDRRFACWWMGIVDLAQSNSRGILRYSEKADFDPYSMTAHAALALLEDLAAN